MLDPDLILKLSEGSEKVASELQDEIVMAIVDRILTRLARGDDYILTPVDKWQLEVLKDAGFLMDDIAKIIAKRTGKTVDEIRRAFAEAGVSSTKFDDITYQAAGLPVSPIQQSPAMIRLLERGVNKTYAEWKNYTGTTAKAAYQLYVQECDKAYNMVLSGAIGYGEAVKRAVQAAALHGGEVVYPSGHRDTLEVATYRAVRTGISQAASDITSTRAAEYGITLFITSAHLGARPTHEPWQGKVFWVDWEKLSSALGIPYNNPTEASIAEKAKYDEFVATTEIGTVTGLCGANCRHSYGPYIEGISHNPYEHFNSEENLKRYETEQKQREWERKIRKQKRVVEAFKRTVENGDPSVVEESKVKLQRERKKLAQMRKDYKAFSEANGLKEQTHRLEITPTNQNGIKENSYPQSPAQKHDFSSDNYEVTDAESAEERLKFLAPIVDQYSPNKSNYSGKVVLLASEENGIEGYADYEGNIHLRLGAKDSTLIHEYLHTKSVSKYSGSYYAMVKTSEEGAVEYLARLICEDQGIPYTTGAYDLNVQMLHFLYSFSTDYESELEFAQDLFNQIPDMRVGFLKGLHFKEGLKDYQKEAIETCLNFFKLI